MPPIRHRFTHLTLLHLSNDLHPRVTGGTEIFIEQLIAAQHGLPGAPRIVWAAHRSSGRDRDHSPTAPLQPHQVMLPPVVSGSRRQRLTHRAAAIPGFEPLLAELRPDLVHLHSLSERCGLSHVRAARRAGARVLVTVHAPGFTCLQGSLLYHRRRICDGLIRPGRCTDCRLVNGGLPPSLARLLALQSGWPLALETPGRLAHLLTARQVTTAYRQAWGELVELVDGFHVLADWSRQVLLANGVPAEKLRLIRTAGPPPLPPRRRRPMQDGVLRLVYWGRCAEVKGLHLVIEAIRSLPARLPLQIDFYGPYWDGAYGRRMQQRIAGDPRFRLLGSLPGTELLPRLQGYDLAVVPSTWLETGPLTVLEAFAAGLPVAGSDLGGIRELLSGVPGCWRLPLQPAAWAALLRSLLGDPLPLAATMPAPRTFAAMAQDLLRFYGSLA